jgi:hypothetical protein
MAKTKRNGTHIIVCTRVRDTPPEHTIPGSKPDGVCDLCGEKVWMSPSSRQMRRRYTGRRCTRCMRDSMTGTEVAVPLSAAQLAEVMAYVKRRDA